MSKTINWWLSKRANDKGQCFYAYRHECFWQSYAVFGSDLPSVAPDLASYIILASESLSQIAALLGKSAEAASWNALSKKQLEILTQVLWDGNQFNCINASTGASGIFEGLLSLIPLILGKRLPEQISGALTSKVKTIVHSWHEPAVIPAALIILGLADSGREAEAKKAVAELNASCVSGGASDARGKDLNAGTFYSPAACAALLALGGTVPEQRKEVL
jgi:hypothetical protein